MLNKISRFALGVRLAAMFAASLSLAFALSGNGLAQNRDPMIPSPNIWVNFEGLGIGDKLADVLKFFVDNEYVYLYPTVSESAGFPSQILYMSAGLPPGYVTKKLEKLLCSWNPHICNSEIKDSMRWTNRPPTEEEKRILYSTPPTMPLPQVCRQKNIPPYVMCVPSLTFEQFTAVTEAQQKDGDESVEKKAVVNYGGCSEEGEECQKNITLLNRSQKVLNSSYRGPVFIPTQGLSIALTFREGVAVQDVVSKFRLFLINYKYSAFRGNSTGNVYYVVPTAPGRANGGGASIIEKGTESSGTQMSNGSLNWNLNYLRSMEYTSYVEDIVLDNQNADVLVSIGIWDGLVDEKHCSFMKKNWSALIDDSSSGVQNGTIFSLIDLRRGKDETPPDFPDWVKNKETATEFERQTCSGERQEPYDDRVDHATFISALIGAQPGNYGMVGINPSVAIWLYHTWRLSTALDKSIMYPYIYKKKVMPPVSVINISQTFKAREDDALTTAVLGPARIFPKGIQAQTLIVSAAGNYYDEPNHIQPSAASCENYPACWSKERRDENRPYGIISVAALNAEADDLLRCKHVENGQPSSTWRGCTPQRREKSISAFGEQYDVAAVGIGKSAYYGNKFGTLAGTSVASAYVTGLTSLIAKKYITMIQNPGLNPLELRNRILFTATPNSWVKYGTVNFERALRFEIDQIKLKYGLASPWRFGAMIRDGSVEFQLKDGQKITAPMDNLLRLWRADENSDNSFRVILRRDQGLAFYTNVTVSGNFKFRTQGDDGTFSLEQQVKIADIQDFVSCSLQCTAPE